LLSLIDNNEITICAGPAGTGKHLLFAQALKLLKNRKEILKDNIS
jgi:phosphate starvation-inducible protein PhoH